MATDAHDSFIALLLFHRLIGRHKPERQHDRCHDHRRAQLDPEP